MRFHNYIFVLLIIISFFQLSSCDNELKVNASPKDIIVVFGVLNPTLSTQYIRLAKVFLTEKDALKYASENDLSLKNAKVTLSFVDFSGKKEEIVLNQVDTVRKDGTFNKNITLYSTRAVIAPGRRYDLSVQLFGESKPAITSYTYVPDDIFPIRPSERPLIGNPDAPDAMGNQEAYPILATDNDNYSVSFIKSAKTSGEKHPGRAFETRVYVNYSEKGSNKVKTLQYGPNGIIDRSTGNCSNISGDAMCIKLGTSFRDFLQTNLDQSKSYTVNASFLSEACKLEYTAVDTFLYNYMRVNNPAFVDFTTVKPEYTNINGGLGVFGSTNSTSVRVRLSTCSKYLAKINDTPQPVNPCK